MTPIDIASATRWELGSIHKGTSTYRMYRNDTYIGNYDIYGTDSHTVRCNVDRYLNAIDLAYREVDLGYERYFKLYPGDQVYITSSETPHAKIKSVNYKTLEATLTRCYVGSTEHVVVPLRHLRYLGQRCHQFKGWID